MPVSSRKFAAWWRQFARTGVIAPLRHGLTKPDVKAILGKPDDVSREDRDTDPPRIWFYGRLELHFDAGHLWLLHMESGTGMIVLTLPMLDPTRPGLPCPKASLRG
jgi:hypothetical protein